MSCEAIRSALTPFLECENTEHGVRILTHCLYPSFEPVPVYVVKIGEGFRVHDAGGAERSAWLHGGEAAAINKLLGRHALRYGTVLRDGAIAADAADESWLLSAVLAVANASASAANAVVERVVVAAEVDLAERVFGVLRRRYGDENVRRKVPVIGQSGKQYDFDFSIPRRDRTPILIDTIVPHHASIAHKYVAFSDVGADGAQMPDRWAVFDRPLAPDDASLMRQVAALVPFSNLEAAMTKEAPWG